MLQFTVRGNAYCGFNRARRRYNSLYRTFINFKTLADASNKCDYMQRRQSTHRSALNRCCSMKWSSFNALARWPEWSRGVVLLVSANIVLIEVTTTRLMYRTNLTANCTTFGASRRLTKAIRKLLLFLVTPKNTLELCCCSLLSFLFHFLHRSSGTSAKTCSSSFSSAFGAFYRFRWSFGNVSTSR